MTNSFVVPIFTIIMFSLLTAVPAQGIDLSTLKLSLANDKIDQNSEKYSVPNTRDIVSTDTVQADSSKRGVVTVQTNLNVRNGAWGTVIGSLGPDAEVEITGREGEFWQIRYNGGTGYIHSNFVRITRDVDGNDDLETKPGTNAGDDVKPVDDNKDHEDLVIGGDSTTTRLGDFQVNGGLTGSEFMSRIARLSGREREQAIREAILAGHVPENLMKFRSVRISRTLTDGQQHTIIYNVAPDYLAIGTNADNVRIPMTPLTAQAIADRMNCLLPTRQMVNQIYSAADTHLSPRAMSGGQYPNWQSRMMTSAFFREHDRLVDSQLSGNNSTGLIAGHKKDIVITNRLNSKPRSVAIYGWHSTSSSPIQPLSTVHGNDYVDYSHGVRMVAGTCTVDGRSMAMADVLRDPVLSGLVSDEGTINDSRAIRL